MEVLTSCQEIIDELYPLHVSVAQRARVKFETYSREYFIEAGNRMPDRHRYFVWRWNGKIIAFSFCTIWNGEIWDNEIGLDYSVAHELNLYYQTFHDIVVWSLRNGLRRYCTGPFDYGPKLQLRLRPVPVDLYVRHKSIVMNSLIRRIAPFFAPVRSDPALRKYFRLHTGA